MTRKTAITILIVVLVLAAIIVGALIFLQKQNNNEGSIEENARNFFGSFFPTDSNPENINPTGDPDDNDQFQPTNTNTVIPKLRQISSVPVAGGTSFERLATTSSLLIQADGSEENKQITETVYRYVERATGHIFETTSRDLTQTRITNTTIPKVYNAYFDSSGDRLAMVTLKSNALQTFIAQINYPEPRVDDNIIQTGTTTTVLEEPELFATLSGTYLPLDSFAFSKNSTGDFIFINKADDTTYQSRGYFYTSNFKTPETQLNTFSHLISEWQTQLLDDGTLALTTKPSASSQGFLYLLNKGSQTLVKILGSRTGLTTLVNNDKTKVIYSYYDSGDIQSGVYDTESGEANKISFSTIAADKCVWSKLETDIVYCAIPLNITRGAFPDAWYQGSYSFNDSIVRIDAENLTANTLMVANSETEANIDAIELQLSPSEDYLIFKNKIDLTLWSLDILN